MANQDRGLSDLLHTAYSLMSSSSQGQSSAPTQAASQPSATAGVSPSAPLHSKKPSQSEILASAQVVMNAAKAKMQKTSSAEEFDMGKLAGAAGTLVGAVSSYGKLDEGNYGKYAQKAQEYLNSYGNKHGKPGTTSPATSPQSAAYTAPSQPYGSEQGHYGSEQGHSTYPAASGGGSQGQGYSSYPPAQGAGYNQGYNQQPSPGFRPTGYPDASQNYGYGQQGYNRPPNSYPDASNEAPMGYPPAGYPPSDNSYPYGRK